MFLRIPFGLAKISTYFIALMQKVLGSFSDFCFFHMDDILVYDSSKEEYLKLLRIHFSKVRQAGLNLKLYKCTFFKKHLQCLGHLISGEEMYPLKKKVASIAQLVPPTYVTETWHIIGIASYSRKLMTHFIDIVMPLNELTKTNNPFF